MLRRVVVTAWKCPVCGAVQGFRGRPFISPRAIALHIAGKAKNQESEHQEQIHEWIPFVDFSSWTSNEIADQIVEFVQEAEPEETISEGSETIDEVAHAEYRLIRAIEIGLHRFIRRRLQEHFGTKGDAWWCQGVPEKVRIECVTRRETDTKRQDPFLYTDLIDLKQILDKDRSVFEENIGNANDYFETKKELLDSLQRLNEIRNIVMHPIRNQEPGEDDLQFVQHLHQGIRAFIGDR